MIRVLIADDEALARDGIRLRLREATDVEIVGEAGDGPESVRRIKALKPDLLFLDIQMRDATASRCSAGPRRHTCRRDFRHGAIATRFRR
jgi:DNA-binding NarL/FixJ family response regulator